MSPQSKVLILGKIPPPYIGPAIATEILLKSGLKDLYELSHLDTNVHESLGTLGGWQFNKVWRNIKLYCRFVGIMLKQKPELVLIPISQTTLGFVKDSVYILLSRLFSRKTLLQLRGSNFKKWLSGASRLTRNYVRIVLRTTQGVIVLGNSLRYLFEEYYALHRIFVVPNGADYHVPSGHTAQNGHTATLLYLSNLLPSKGIEDVIQSACLLKKKYDSDFTLNIVGSWADSVTKDKCHKLLEKDNLHVCFHSSCSGAEKFQFFSQADIFVFTPREAEGHPWVIVEALAAGLPIISTDQGTITDSVLNGVNGFIVDVRNPGQIADRLQLLIEQPELRKKLGQASRAHYLQHFTEETMVGRLSFAIDSVLPC